MKYKALSVTFLSLGFFFSQLSSSELRIQPHKSDFEFSFLTDYDGWVGDYTDYPAGEEAFYELAWGWDNLPKIYAATPFDLTKGLFISGNNHSDDLFMFLKRQISGLKPNTFYDLNFTVLIESNTPAGAIGVGGSPGESVYFKVGASPIEPKKNPTIVLGDFYLFNLDKGNQSVGGKDAIVIGDMANPLVDPLNPQYAPKELSNDAPFKVKSDSQGKLWVFVGTDSGYESTTKFYVVKINITAFISK